MQESYNAIPDGYKKGKTKYIIITGSVISGVGKGTFSACLGTLLKLKHGFNIAPLKFDGYLNVDAGTLNPYRHGEVFVLDDGTESDLDLGSYERMLSQDLDKDNYLTGGKIFKIVIDKERKGDYLGRDVQIIPHVTGEIKGFIRNLALKRKADVILVEVGGTAGDMENEYFLEAMRELKYEEGAENVCFVNVTYILEPVSLGEFKSKAAQLGLRKLMELGIQPDMVVCRSRNPVPESVREKISMFSNVLVNKVINMYNIGNLYQIPLFLEDLNVDTSILETLELQSNNSRGFDKWKAVAEKTKSFKGKLTIGITGKYTNVHDSYISILKSLEHSTANFGYTFEVKWIETTDINSLEDASKALEGLDGIIVPGGFGERGVEGKILCIQHARQNNLPFLGLCYGMQLATVEFARNVCGLEKANTTEVDSKTKHPVICILPEQEEIKELGGTMRLGGHDVVIKEDTLAYKLYGKGLIRERFRHRYNVNTKYIDLLEEKGLVFSGKAPEKRIMQIAELPDHKFFLGAQFHPEFTSRPLSPNPLFKGFIEACLGKSSIELKKTDTKKKILTS